LPRLAAVRRNRSFVVEGQRTPKGRKETAEGVALRRRPPCRNFGGDPRSKELAGRIVEQARRIAALQREQLADIAEFDETESWRGDGAVSMIAWVTAQCRVSSSTARQWVRSGFNLKSLPCLAEGLASGDLSLDLVEPLAEVASPSNDAALREASQHWSVSQARDLATWHKAQKAAEAEAAAKIAAAAGPPTNEALENEAARDYDRRTLRFNDTQRSMWMAFPEDDYAAAKSVLVGRVEAEKRRSEAATSDPLGYVPYDKLLYDVCIDQLRAGKGSASAVPPRVVVHAPLELLIGCSSGGVAEIAGVGPVSIDVVRRLACDAKVDLAVEDATGSILNQGRARRDPTSVQRVEIDRRDKGCRFPGCSFTEFTHVHHIEHWGDGGATNLDNLVTLCGRHHRAVHELGWTVSGDADAVLTFESPHGRSMRSVPSPTWHPSSVVRSAPSQSGQSGRNGPLRR
jgi:Domain of unknown function (DUF222)/HNH endonuclease